MLSSSTTNGENRRIQRISLGLPSRIEVKIDQTNTWNEITRLSDLSAFGAGFNLKRPVKRGRLLYMTVPMPRQLRCYDYMEPQYKVWGLVRRCIMTDNRPTGENYAHGVAFIGKNPPVSYLDNPAKLYEITHREDQGLWHITEAPAMPDESALPKDLRRHSRLSIPESLLLETLDDNGLVTGTETTVTENISLGGAAIFTSLKAETGSFLRVTSDRHSVALISVVRGKRIGTDGIPRVHIEFIDRFFPLEGIE
jgi:hypothetical protein